MKVKIKDWYDMIEERSLDENGNIKCHHFIFTTEMKEYCGEVIEVEGAIFLTFDNTNVFIYNGWFFSDDMYEIVEE